MSDELTFRYHERNMVHIQFCYADACSRTYKNTEIITNYTKYVKAKLDKLIPEHFWVNAIEEDVKLLRMQ